MTDIIERLKEPEAHYPGNFDTPKRANAMLSCLCQEAMEEIESLRRELAASQASEQQLRAHLEVITGKRMSADNCLGNVEIAELAIALPQDTAAIEAMIAKAGEVMRERTHSAMLDLKPWDHRGEIIRALPAVTIDDMK